MEETEFNYINVIPLVDVMLVLLTIVLTTSTFVATGVIPVDLPKSTRSHAESLKTLAIEIDKGKNIYLNSTPVAIDKLSDSLDEFDKNNPVLIRADKGISIQLFVDVLDVVKNLDFKKVSLQTDEDK